MLPRHSSSSFEKPPKRAFATRAVYVTVIAAPGPVEPKEWGRWIGPRLGGRGMGGRDGAGLEATAGVERCGPGSTLRPIPRPTTLLAPGFRLLLGFPSPPTCSALP